MSPSRASPFACASTATTATAWTPSVVIERDLTRPRVVVTARDAQLWAWKAHNKVNARLAEREANGLGAGSGDPAFPKTQWPDASACEACRAPITGAGARGDPPDGVRVV